MSSKLFLVSVCIAIFIHYVDAFDELQIKNDIEYINSVQSSWKADNSSLARYSMKEWKKKLGIRLISKQLNKLRKSFVKSFVNKFRFVKSSGSSESTYPENYDVREAHPYCKSLTSTIRDQSACGSCWAVATASTISDRLCIVSEGEYDMPLSAEDLMRCCERCKSPSGNGCDGGDVVAALIYSNSHGIVTGGEYDSGEGCIPYSFAPCSSSDLKNNKQSCAYVQKGAETQECQAKCSNSKYQTNYENDKMGIRNAYLLPNKVDVIKEELMTGGSCMATMEVHEDFILYKLGDEIYNTKDIFDWKKNPAYDGVFFHVTGKKLGDHGVRLIGWGVENGIEYWLVANSWGESWGDKGLVKIRIEKNNCKFGNIICPVP